jgi:putative transposase
MPSSFLQALRQVRRGDCEMQALLPAEEIDAAVAATDYRERGTLYTAVSTILTFLGQVLRADRSCQRAVNALAAQRVGAAQAPCSADTGGYCKARKRLPEAVCTRLMQQSGAKLEAKASAPWRWQGRRVLLADGSTLKIADTAANRQEYPLQQSLMPGTSYPVVRILVLFSLAVAGVIDGLLRPYQGKGTGETAMVRDLAEHFRPDDILLGDRYFSGYWDIAYWLRRGVDVVTRLSNNRTSDFRRGQRLGADDHLIMWRRTERPDWITPEEAANYPAALTLREMRVRVQVRGFRPKVIIVVTTLLDAEAYPANALAELYRRRWQAELQLRDLKTQMGMEQLATKSPAMVRKEFAMYLLAYNCVRRVTVEAALLAGVEPWQISFKGAWQSLTEFLARLHSCSDVTVWLEALLATAAQTQVGDRPDRHEPYRVKRRPKDFPFLRRPRAEYKRRHGASA